MDDDHRIQEAIANGQKNRQTMELIHNWCRHARVEKAGGTGLIEIETGLPIGHHHMACDHAPAGGFACWDLADAALDFHDRNCVDCAHRVAVRLPNLTSLLQQRDAYRKRADDDERAREDKAAAQRIARQNARQTLRAQLGPLSATIVDHIEDLDQDSKSDASPKLLGAAQLAPETFTPAVVEHCFGLLEAREAWFDETGLRILQALGADPTRLTRFALLSLHGHRSTAVAAALVETNIAFVDESLAADALPALVDLAHPTRTIPMGFERELVPGPLLALHQAHRSAVEVGIGKLLDQHDPYLVSAGARAITVLAQEDKAIASRFTRSLVTKLARAKWLIDSRETGYLGDDEVIPELQDALALALEHSPEETDALMIQFIQGAPTEGEVRIYKVYERVVHGDRFRTHTPRRSSAVFRTAFRRLIAAATTARDDEVLREIQHAFSYIPEGCDAFVREELTAVLGAAILMDDRIQRFDSEPTPNNDFLGQLERQNYRGLLLDLQNNLIKWAANGASGNSLATEQYIDILSRTPDTQDIFRSALIKNAYRLMETPDGLNAVLPALYTAMVGASTRVRAAAATAVGKLERRRRGDVPDLLYEAFTNHLVDPYVIVHCAAVEALKHLELPEDLCRRAKAGLTALIYTYSASHDNDRFLLECLELYLRQYSTKEEKRGNVGKIFVALLDKMKPDVVAEKLSWLRHDLREVEGFASVVLRILADPEVSDYRHEDILRTLNDLPASAILADKSKLEAIATAPGAARSLAPSLVETLTRAGAWEEAARITEAVYASIPNTTQKRPQKLMANLDRIAVKYEESIAVGKMDSLPDLAKEWRTTEAQIKDDRIQNAQRRNPFPGIPGTD